MLTEQYYLFFYFNAFQKRVFVLVGCILQDFRWELSLPVTFLATFENRCSHFVCVLNTVL